jgi:hypothetical protein
MNKLQQLGAQALRDRALPFGARPFAETLARCQPGTSPSVERNAIEALLARTANWKSPNGKRIKRELRGLLEQELVG